MSELKTIIHNLATGEIIERLMTDEEIESHQKYILAAKLDEDNKEKSDTDKAAAEAKLAALGLTKEDLQALGL